MGKHRPDLTDGQKDCLRLVDDHLTSKEIARILAISPFTVDQRLDAARRKLGAPNRVEAARAFAAIDQGILSERLVYHPSALATGLSGANLGEPSNLVEQVNGVTPAGDYAASGNFRFQQKGLLSAVFSILPVPPIGGPRHDLQKRSVVQYSMNVALYSAVIIAMLIIILTGVMRMYT